MRGGAVLRLQMVRSTLQVGVQVAECLGLILTAQETLLALPCTGQLPKLLALSTAEVHGYDA